MTYENLWRFVDVVRRQQEADLDVIVAVTGRKGMGKSTFAMQVTRRILHRYFGERHVNVKRYVAYNNQDLKEKIFRLPPFSPIVADEAARFAMGEDWNKSDSKELKKLIAQIRTKHLAIFMCLPEFLWLDKKYRDGMVTQWVWVPTRQRAHVFEPDDNPGEPDVWHLRKLARAGYISKFTDSSKLTRVSAKNPCFRYEVMFPKLPDEIYQRYVELRDKIAYEESLNREPEGSRHEEYGKIMAYNLVKNWDVFKNGLDAARGGVPNARMLQDTLMVDPRTHKVVATQSNLCIWIREVDAGVRSSRRKVDGGVVDGA
jgi:hypothetical protein